MNNTHISRRCFVRVAAAAAPWLLPARALGLDGAAAPSERITLGAIGLGTRGLMVLESFLGEKDVQCLAVADCFADRRRAGKQMVDGHYGNTDCAASRMHDDILARNDIDAVLVCTGDRWHTPLSILAAKAGKDAFCEKPFSLTIEEGRRLVDATRRYGTVWQCGTQRRSNDSYRFVVEMIGEGKIGKPHTITALLGGWGGNGTAAPQPEPDPDTFDYDRWLGPAPWAPYSPVRVRLWRNVWATGAGVIADMGAHYFDFAQWARGSYTDVPVEFEGNGKWPDGGIAEVPFSVAVTARYADGVRLLMNNGPKGVRFDGDEGWLHVADDGRITGEPKAMLAASVPRMHWAVMSGHSRDFLDCIRARRLTRSHPEVAHRVHTICHCANIALRLGRKVTWDPATEQFVGDATANRMLSRPARPPWEVG